MLFWTFESCMIREKEENRVVADDDALQVCSGGGGSEPRLAEGKSQTDGGNTENTRRG